MKIFHNILSVSMADMSLHSCRWPVCLNVTTSLVNVSLKFQTLISQIHQYFCWKNMRSFSHYFNKKFLCICLESGKTLKSWPLNELVKLTMQVCVRYSRLDHFSIVSVLCSYLSYYIPFQSCDTLNKSVSAVDLQSDISTVAKQRGSGPNTPEQMLIDSYVSE